MCSYDNRPLAFALVANSYTQTRKILFLARLHSNYHWSQDLSQIKTKPNFNSSEFAAGRQRSVAARQLQPAPFDLGLPESFRSVYPVGFGTDLIKGGRKVDTPVEGRGGGLKNTELPVRSDRAFRNVPTRRRVRLLAQCGLCQQRRNTSPTCSSDKTPHC